MRVAGHLRVTIAAVVVISAFARESAAQGRIATAKSLRCTFPIAAAGAWRKEGSAEAVVKPATLVLVFDAINIDEGTARLRSGSVGSEITVRLSGGYLHFVQAFRTGALYTTTVFDRAATGGRLKAVHSRHEYFDVPLAGATSSPEQYYGECEITS